MSASAVPSDGLRKKMVALMKAVAYIQKDGTNEFQGYRYVTAARVLGKVQEALIGLGLFSLPEFSIIRIDDVERKEPPKGQRVIVECKLTVMDADGQDSGYFTATALGGGQDVGDKAVMKAQTAAMKCAWMQLLNISTGDDPEGDEATDRDR